MYLPWLDCSSSLVTYTDLKELLAIRSPSLISILICSRSFYVDGINQMFLKAVIVYSNK